MTLKELWSTILKDVLLPLLGVYLLGLAALLLFAWRRGSVVSRGPLLSLGAKPLLYVPRIGKWFMFLGYTSRFLKDKVIQQTGKIYFDLPARDPRGQSIDPTTKADSIIAAIAKE